jgi:hypothetical protein
MVNHSGVWSTHAFWNPAGVPTSAPDTATINITPGAGYMVDLDSDPTLSGFTLNSADATFLGDGNTVYIVGGNLDLLAGNLSGTPLSLSSFGVAGTSAITLGAGGLGGSGPLTGRVMLLVGKNSATTATGTSATLVAADDALAPTQELSIASCSSCGDNTLDITAADFTNRGLIALRGNGNNTQLKVNNAGAIGRLTNLSTIISMGLTTGGHNRIQAELHNGPLGAVGIQHVTLLGLASGTGGEGHVNQGLIDVVSPGSPSSALDIFGDSFTLAAGGKLAIGTGTSAEIKIGAFNIQPGAILSANGTIYWRGDKPFTFTQTGGVFEGGAAPAIYFEADDGHPMDVNLTSGHVHGNPTLNFSGDVDVALGAAGNYVGPVKLQFGPYSSGVQPLSAELDVADNQLAPGRELTIISCGSCGTNTLEINAAVFTNRGTIGVHGNAGTNRLKVDNAGAIGRLINTSKITTTNPGPGGAEQIHVRLNNTISGRFEIINNVTELGDISGTGGEDHINSGIIQLSPHPTSAAENAYLDLYGSSFINTSVGKIIGVGTLDATHIPSGMFVNHGYIAPGLSPGILKIVGNVVQGNTGRLAIEVDGLVPGTGHDQLRVMGNFDLRGFVMLDVDPGVTLTASDQLVVATASSFTGTLPKVLGAPPNLAASTTTVGGQLRVEFAATTQALWAPTTDSAPWSDPASWNPVAVPGYQADVVMQNTSGPASVATISGTQESVHSLSMSGTPASPMELRIENGGLLSVSGDLIATGAAQLAIDQATLIVGGNFDTVTPGEVLVSMSTVMVTGDLTQNGTWNMTGGLLDVGGTARFAGTAQLNDVEMTSLGAASIDGSLTIDSGELHTAGDTTVSGLLEAVGVKGTIGGRLQIDFGGEVTWVPGTEPWEFDALSDVNVAGQLTMACRGVAKATLGGDFNVESTGVATISNLGLFSLNQHAQIDGSWTIQNTNVASSANIDVGAAGSVAVTGAALETPGTTTIAGAMTIANAAATFADLTVTATGSFTANADAPPDFEGAAVSVTGNTQVSGSMTITDSVASFSDFTMTDTGVFTASGSTTHVEFLPNSQGQVAGEMLVSNGATIVIRSESVGTWSMAGAIMRVKGADSTLSIEEGADLVVTGLLDIQDGQVSVTGGTQVNGTLMLNTLFDGASYGQSATGVYELRPGSLTTTLAFGLDLSADAELDGVFRLNPSDLATPPGDGDFLPIIGAAGGVSGEFSVLASTEPLGVAMSASYGSNVVFINFVTPVAAAFSGTGVISTLGTTSRTDLNATAGVANGSLILDVNGTGFRLRVAGNNPTMTVSGAAGISYSFTERVTIDAGGVLAGGGWTLYTPALVNGGVVSPGNSPGTITLVGDYQQTAAGELVIEIGGTAPGTEYDVLAIDGAATLGGLLTVELLDLGGGLFAPQLGDAFDILTATGGLGGTQFAMTDLPTLAVGLQWNLAYSADVVTLLVGLAGDYNGDGMVDAADYVVWRKSDGTQAGYDRWRANFGATIGAGSSTIGPPRFPAVPEPTACLLLAVGVTAIAIGAVRR